jgi:hypothetical protein
MIKALQIYLPDLFTNCQNIIIWFKLAKRHTPEFCTIKIFWLAFNTITLKANIMFILHIFINV